MATVNRISQITPQTLHQERLTDSQLQRRIQLHTSDSVELIKSIRTDRGRMALPTSDPQQQATLREVYATATPEQQKELAQASYQLAQALSTEAGKTPEVAASSAGLQNAMSHGFQTYMVTKQPTTIEDLTTGTIFMAYDGAEQKTYDLAQQLQGNLDGQKLKREEIAEFRNTLVDWPEGAETQEFTWTDEKGVTHTEQLTKEHAQTKVEELEGQLATMRDMTQQWQLELQDAMNKQQQALQLLSGVMKAFHDTAKAIIQNLRA